ncbi:HDOD domain-containing protein [Marinobacterium arenosum]|uniref:HDOD domain-containing protein n=1 Tax=Marinobacterium arenosum TaxID=2862496 RepID=UPI001C982AE3|nr:HDOD domain-containing protein [Marinobacterium arenosum]MBY4675863.1 HDOD domain-containing protein [Marinobacterium arenosum]
MPHSNPSALPDTLQQLLERLHTLPLLPSVLARLMAMDADSDAFFRNLLLLTEQDPSLALLALRLANSAHSAPSAPVLTLNQAVSRIGGRIIAELMASRSVFPTFVPSSPAERGLWQNSLQTAIAARLIAKQSRHLNVNPDQAYCAGLLLNIGRLILFESQPAELTRLEARGWQVPQRLVLDEREQFGFDHAMLGHQAMKRWNIPQPLRKLVKLHYYYGASRDTRIPPQTGAMLTVLQQAELISVMLLKVPHWPSLSAGELNDLIIQRCFHSKWQRAALTELQIAQLLPQIQSRTERAMVNLALRPAGDLV